MSSTTWKKVAFAISFAFVVLVGVNVYSATSQILIEGTIPDSKLFHGAAKVTVR